jgi:CRISPR-associated protein Csm1
MNQSINYLLKGDISGIQEYIFNTKSKGASKTLKAKSFFVQALAEMCIKLIEEEFGEQNVKLLYNGGGNFYLFVPQDKDKLKAIQKTIAQSLREDEIYVALSWTENLPDFVKTKQNLERKAITSSGK